MPETITKRELETLVKTVKDEHGAILKAEKTSLTHARKAGEQLVRLKVYAKASKYQWEPWIEAETGVSSRMVNNYIRIAEGWERVKDEPTIRAALMALRTPRAKRQTKKLVRSLTTNQITDLMHRFGFPDGLDKLTALLQELGIKIIEDADDHEGERDVA